MRDRGATLHALLDEIEAAARRLPADHEMLANLRAQILEGSTTLREAAALIVRESPSDPELIGSVAHQFLQWLGVLIGGWQWTQYATTALAGKPGADADATLNTAAFYAAHILPRMRTHAAIVAAGSSAVARISPSSI